MSLPPQILLAQLKALLARTPSFDNFTPASSEHLQWLGQAFALVNRWNSTEAIFLKVSADFLGGVEFDRGRKVGAILGTVHRAIADLELQLPASNGQAFGPGALYDFFKALSSVIASANKSVFVLDPYLDDKVFDTYLSAISRNVNVRLLTKLNTANIKAAKDKFTAQYQTAIDIRKSNAFHDRVIFIDDSECWVLGQSIANAATSMPTYLAPLSADIAQLKLADYENVWLSATQI